MLRSVVHVLYKSTALTDPFSPEEQTLMDFILPENKKLGITGFLVRTETHFYQYLEGKDRTIREVLERIRRNPLHTDFKILTQATSKDRNFPRWYMEYYFLTEAEAVKRFKSCVSDQDMAERMLTLMQERADKRCYLNLK